MAVAIRRDLIPDYDLSCCLLPMTSWHFLELYGECAEHESGDKYRCDYNVAIRHRASY